MLDIKQLHEYLQNKVLLLKILQQAIIIFLKFSLFMYTELISLSIFNILSVDKKIVSELNLIIKS
jgi:hypothetical protein